MRLRFIAVKVLGAIGAVVSRFTLGVAVAEWENVMLRTIPNGEVNLKVYCLPLGPEGILKVIYVVEIDTISRPRFVVFTANAIRL